MASGQPIDVYLIDGTYELFRQFYGRRDQDPSRATAGVVSTVVTLLDDGVRHIGVATDHVIESFRNQMYAEYKTGEGIDPDLFEQIHVLEKVLADLGVCVWPTIELEADDAIASACATAASDQRVRQVKLMSPDKDLAQLVSGNRVVQVDVRNEMVLGEAEVIAKYGVPPSAIADWLALVGDSADGYPGIPKWGKKSASLLLARYGSIEDIPSDCSKWDVVVRGAQSLATSLQENFDDAMLFKQLATLRVDDQLCPDISYLEWLEPADDWHLSTSALGSQTLVKRIEKLLAVS